MNWMVDERDDETVWTRADDNAIVRVRRTAAGEWAVSYDRLRQAPAGEAYRHETFTNRESARRQAEAWRE